MIYFERELGWIIINYIYFWFYGKIFFWWKYLDEGCKDICF